MPKCNGFDFLALIRKEKNLKRTPFIFITAKTSYDDVRAGMSLGADDYLTKPFVVTDVKKSINAVLKKHKHYQEEISILKDNVGLIIPNGIADPLTALLGYSSIMNKTVKEQFINNETYEMVQILHNSAQKIYSQIKKIKKYRDYSSFNFSYNVKNISSVGKVIYNSALRAGDRFNRSNHLHFDIIDVPILFDEDLLTFIIDELVDNAIKHSEENKDIFIRGFIQDNFYVIKILDQGFGMTKDQISFYLNHKMPLNQVTPSKRGLGLRTINRIIEANNCGFTISSKLNEYTEVTITLNTNFK